MKASDELLELRERVAAKPWDRYRAGTAIADLPMRVWRWIDDVVPGPALATSTGELTHLEVVEMIERAAMAAKEAEGE